MISFFILFASSFVGASNFLKILLVFIVRHKIIIPRLVTHIFIVLVVVNIISTASAFILNPDENFPVLNWLSYSITPPLLLFSLYAQPKKIYLLRPTSTFILLLLFAGMQLFANPNQTNIPFLGSLCNSNLLAYLFISVSFLQCSTQSNASTNDYSTKFSLYILLVASFIIFKSRISLLAIFFKIIFDFICAKYHFRRMLIPSFLLSSVLVYNFMLPSMVVILSYGRSIKDGVNASSLDTFSDSFRLIAAPMYVAESLSSSTRLLFLGHGFSKVPSVFEQTYDIKNNTIANNAESKSDRLHNAYLSILYQGGLIGLFSWLCFLCALLYYSANRYGIYELYLLLICVSSLFLPATLFGAQQVTAICILSLRASLSKINSVNPKRG
jgi:hypothetical protein